MVVGVLAEVEGEDAGYVRAQLAVVGELLDRAGAGRWAEPELDERDVLAGDMWGYSGLHAVRRVAVHPFRLRGLLRAGGFRAGHRR